MKPMSCTMIRTYEIRFSVQKEKLKYVKDGERQREHMCSKEGFLWDSDHLDNMKFKKLQLELVIKLASGLQW